MIATLRRYLIRVLKPISIVAGHLYFAPKYRAVKASDVIDIKSMMQVGDVVLTYSKGELTNYLIEGEFKHCAMYIGSGSVIEAVGKGVRVIDFESFAASKDKIAVSRANFCDANTAKIAANFALFQEGKPYDYSFEPNENAFYCAELIAEAYQVATGDNSPFILRTVMGVETVLPNDFYMARKKFDLIIERPLV